MDFTRTGADFARELDAQDELASFRDEFVLDDPNLIYLDGNSLGRLPKRTAKSMQRVIEKEWGQRLIRGWNDGWINFSTDLGAKIAKLVGARVDEVIVTEATSINLFKLAVAALKARPDRTKSVQQTEYLIFLAEQWLVPLGFTIGSPRQAERRGSHVSLRHPEGYRISRAIIEAEPPAVKVIPDFREPNNIRLGIAPLYTTFTEIHRAMTRIRTIVAERIYEQYSAERLAVT